MDLSDTRDHLTDIDERVTALEGDIGRCDGCLSSAELSDWSTWRTRWRADLIQLRARVDQIGSALQAASLGGVLVVGAAESVATKALADVDRDADRWGNELTTWQQRAAAKGATLTAPGSAPALGLPWTTIAVIGAGVAAVVGLAVYTSRTRTRKRRRADADA